MEFGIGLGGEICEKDLHIVRAGSQHILLLHLGRLEQGEGKLLGESDGGTKRGAEEELAGVGERPRLRRGNGVVCGRRRECRVIGYSL